MVDIFKACRKRKTCPTGIHLMAVVAFLFLMPCRLCVSAEIGASEWTAADMLPADSGVSILRYGSFGLGAYPYRYSFPGASMNVTVDDVPLRSMSPFGPDISLISTKFIDSIHMNSARNMNIITGKVNEDESVTTTRFLLGTHRRFDYSITINRNLSDRSGFLFNGTSSGIHGFEGNEKNSLRNYFLKYRRNLENGSVLNLSVLAFRDRDGLINTEKRAHMGERRTDNTTVSMGVKKYSLRDNLEFSPTVYIQSSTSRFDRSGQRKSMDETAGGLILGISSNNEKLTVYHDIVSFDSRIHDKSWTRHETAVIGELAMAGESMKIDLSGGVRSSSEYGVIPEAEMSVMMPLMGDFGLEMKGILSGGFPNSGDEYYPALVFSDSNHVSVMDKYLFSELETGIGWGGEVLSMGVYGFVSSGQMPFFEYSNSIRGIGHKMRYQGGRIRIQTMIDSLFTGETTLTYTIGNDRGVKTGENTLWPYPDMELTTTGNLHRDLYKNIIKSVAFGTVRIDRWSDDVSTPDGLALFVDAGLSMTVSTLELFYRIENITNENMTWFNTLGWQGRNAMWGINWNFYN